MPKSQGHYVELQSLRGIAACVVLIEHCLGYFRTPAWIDFCRLALNEKAAVVSFFVLSGFVLTRSLMRAPISTSTVLQFYVRRLFRIFPAIWAASLLSLAYLALFHFKQPVPGVSEWFADRFHADRFNPVFVAASFAGLSAFLLPPVWSIAVELVASVLLPFGAALGKRPVAFIGAALGLVALGLTVGYHTPYRLGVYLAHFMLGASICLFPPAWRSWLVGLGRWRLPAFALAFLILNATAAFGEAHFAIARLIEALATTSIIALLVYSGLDLPTLRTAPMIRLGDISYSVYLVHFPVMCLVGLPLAFSGVDPNLGPWLLAAVTIALTLPLSTLLYEKVEMAGQELGKRALAWRAAIIRTA